MLFSKYIIDQFGKRILRRYDSDGAVFFYSAKDFEGLNATPFSFQNNLGHMLKGYFYSYNTPQEGQLVIFNHGMGEGGHRAYMREIEHLARQGYLVYAYDHTGCMESEGDGINGFAQSLADLDMCLRALKADESYKGMKMSVIGHSWGGYAVLNVAAYHPDVAHVIALAGFRSIRHIHQQTMTGLLRLYVKDAYRLELRHNAAYADADAANSLKNCSAQVLIVHSADDPTVSATLHHESLKKELAGKENIRFLTVSGKAHSPNYTDDAVQYKDGTFIPALLKGRKDGTLATDEQKSAFIASLDWKRMTEQDSAVWKEIFEVLEK